MHKLTWLALSAAFAMPALAAPAKPAPTPAKAPARPVLLSKTLTPDSKTPIANVKNTPIPDVAPVAAGYHAVINIPQQRLFLYNNGTLEKVYPVGVGKAMTQTNLGEHTIGAKAFDPTWHIPLSIQKERGDGVKAVPPGPHNPLGPVFVRLGNPKLGLGIHGTSNPRSVPGVVSHGCVRMKSEQALDFARTIPTGSAATVSYELAALNQDGAGNLWLAVFRDPYNKKNLRTSALKQSISAWSKEHNRPIRAAQIDQIVRARTGNLVCLTCTSKAPHKISGSLISIAWNSGSAKPTQPKGTTASVRPVKDDVLPEGTEIEIDAGDEPASSAPTRSHGAISKEVDDFQGATVFDDEESVISETPLTPIEKR